MRVSNYEITKQRVQKEFLKYDQEEMIRKFSLKADENYLYLKMLNRPYRISRLTGLAEWSEDDFESCVEAGFNDALTIYDLLCDSKPYCRASGKFVNLKSLSSLQSGSKKLGDGLFKDAELFDHKESLLSTACEKMGGMRGGKGDVSYDLPLFEFLPCRIEFWNSDEEFPASFQMFFDGNVLDFIRYETVWYAVMYLWDRLEQEMRSESWNMKR